MSWPISPPHLHSPPPLPPSVFQQGGENGVTVAELTEQKIGLVLLEVCHKAGGSDYLRQIYHIIQGNEVRKHSHSPAIRWLLAWGRRLFLMCGGGVRMERAPLLLMCSLLFLIVHSQVTLMGQIERDVLFYTFAFTWIGHTAELQAVIFTINLLTQATKKKASLSQKAALDYVKSLGSPKVFHIWFQ